MKLMLAQQRDVEGSLPPVAEGLALQTGGQHLKLAWLGNSKGDILFLADLFHNLLHLPALVVEYSITARFDDAGLLLRNQCPGIPQLGGVLQADVGNYRRLRGWNHIGGVQPSAQPHLKHYNVALRFQEIEHPHSGHQLKLGGRVLHPLPGGNHLFSNAAQCLVGNGLAVHLEPLMESPQVGRGGQPGFQPRRSQNRGNHGCGGALAVCPGNVDIFQLFMGISHPVQQLQGPAQAGLAPGPGLLVN